MIVLDIIDNAHEMRYGLCFKDNEIKDADYVLHSLEAIGLKGRLIKSNLRNRKKVKEYIDNLPWD